MRAAVNTLKLMVAQAAENPDPQALQNLSNALQFYLPTNQPAEKVLSPDQLQALHR